MNIANWDFSHARQHGASIALIAGGRAWTVLELHEQAARLAEALIGLGARPGERIAIALPNSPELFVAASAGWMAGLVVVVLPPGPEEVTARMRRHCEPALTVYSAHPDPRHGRPLAPIVAVGSDPGGATLVPLAELIERSGALAEPVPRAAADPAQLCYTSGSTGAPRAAVYTHAGIDAFLRARADGSARLTGASVMLIATPPTSAGARFVRMRLAGAACHVLLDRFDPAAVLEAIERYRVTEMPLVPAMAEALTAFDGGRPYDCSSLRGIDLSGAHVASSLIKRLKSRLGRLGAAAGAGGVPVTVHYGLTEAGGAVSAGTEGGDGCVGRLLPGVRVRILTEQGEDAAPGEVGEILVGTPYAASEYWRDPAATAEVFQGGYVRTGDLGTLDAAGALSINGRRKAQINQGGHKIATHELGEAIGSLAGVRECEVIGVPNELLGEEAVACVVRASPELTEQHVLAHCAIHVDSRQQPARVRFFDELPRTHNGKLDREALRRRVAGLAAGIRILEPSEVEAAVLEGLAASLAEAREAGQRIDPDAPFGELGLSSLGAVRLAHELGERLGRHVSPVALYAHPTAARLSRYLCAAPAERPAGSLGSQARASAPPAVAIVGIGCRLPAGIESPEALWRALVEERDGIAVMPAARAGGISGWRCGFLEAPDRFDAGFFRLSADAQALDPRHRMVLEVAWEALEDAGHDPLSRPSRRTGVFLGMYGARYASGGVLAAEPAMAAAQLCQFLDIRGPVLTINTTCSSSLVAIHYAVQSLRAGECDLAIVGGASLLSPAHRADSLGVVSRAGRCRAFDAAADGFAEGEGCVLLVLEQCADARERGGRVYASILGSAINHDGRSASLTAPNAAAQEEVIRAATQSAGIEPDAIQYVEAHGTGTLLGDPIEVEGLSRALAPRKSAPLKIGSLKTNFGHLEAAAGAAGVAKVALAISKRQLPASLNFETPNPHIAWAASRVEVQSRSGPWPSAAAPLIAGVSAFGLSGTNAHAILSEPEPEALDRWAEADALARSEGPWVLPLSARSPAALRAAAERWAAWLERDSGAFTCRDIAYTASCLRTHFEHRAAPVASTRSEWIAALREVASGRGASGDLALDPTLQREGDARRGTARALSALYVAGHPIDWSQRYRVRGRCASLPTYAWEHGSYWQVGEAGQAVRARPAGQAERAGQAQQTTEAVRARLIAAPHEARTGSAEEYLRERLVSHHRVPAERLRASATLESLGLDSLALIDLGAHLRDALDASVPPEALQPSASFSELAAALAAALAQHGERATARQGEPIERTESTPTGFLSRIRTDGIDPLHLWIHPAGGGIACYRALAEALPFEAAAIEAAALYGPSPLPESVESLARAYLNLMAEEDLAHPLVLGGWSLGGLIAFELASQLEGSGVEVERVILIDSYLSPPPAQGTTVERLESFIRAMRLDRLSAAKLRELRALTATIGGADPDTAGARAEIAASAARGGLLEGLAPQDAVRLYRMFESHLAAVSAYRPPTYAGEVLSIRASSASGEPDRRWREVAPRTRVEIVDADHFSILERAAAQVIGIVGAAADESRGSAVRARSGGRQRVTLRQRIRR